jgi:hypothetical protein
MSTGEEGSEFILEGLGVRSHACVNGPIDLGDVNLIQIMDAKLALGLLAVPDKIRQRQRDEQAKDRSQDRYLDEGEGRGSSELSTSKGQAS